jgi:putative endonuclease
MKAFFVYMLARARNGTLYIGVASDLVKRVWQHQEDAVEGFTRKYGTKTLVWYEAHDDAEAAISREKQIKKWTRAWKIELIEAMNPYWNDLYASIIV